VFAPVLPINTLECQLTRGGTTIRIRTTVLVESIRSYRVDVKWSPTIGGQYLYISLQSRFPEHLPELRGVIESVHFSRDASTGSDAHQRDARATGALTAELCAPRAGCA